MKFSFEFDGDLSTPQERFVKSAKEVLNKLEDGKIINCNGLAKRMRMSLGMVQSQGYLLGDEYSFKDGVNGRNIRMFANRETVKEWAKMKSE